MIKEFVVKVRGKEVRIPAPNSKPTATITHAKACPEFAKSLQPDRDKLRDTLSHAVQDVALRERLRVVYERLADVAEGKEELEQAFSSDSFELDTSHLNDALADLHNEPTAQALRQELSRQLQLGLNRALIGRRRNARQRSADLERFSRLWSTVQAASAFAAAGINGLANDILAMF